MYITSACVISNHAIYKDSNRVFVNNNGGLPDLLNAAYGFLGVKYPKFYKMDSLSKLGWLATEILMQGFDPAKYLPAKKGVLITNANSSLDTDLKYFETIKAMPSPALFVYTLPNIVMGEICIRHNFKGENAFFIFEQFNANFIEYYVSNLINNNILQACICGWVDVLAEDYKAMLLMVEKEAGDQSIPFTKEHINKIYQSG